MKKALRLVLMLMLIFTVALSTACSKEETTEPEEKNAVEYTSGDYRYIRLSRKAAMITDYTGSPFDVNLSIPDKLDGYRVTAIGDNVFSRCEIWSVSIPDGVISIGNGAFKDCYVLDKISIPDSVTSIGNNAFEGCIDLKRISIPNSVTSIGDNAFEGCTYLERISIPNSVTTIGMNPFAGCLSLNRISVSSDHPVFATIGGVLINKSEKKLVSYPCAFTEASYAIPNDITVIGDGAFSNCSSLKSVSIPNSVIAIGDSAFSRCEFLTSISIPKGVTSIGSNAFSGCWRLTSITLLDSVTSIGDSAFYNCSALDSIFIPNSVTTMGSNPFVNCAARGSITVSPDHPVFAIIEGVLINKSEKKLVSYPSASTETSYSIPDDITVIGGGAFYNCRNLKSISIPNSVTSICDSAFNGCEYLTRVSIPNGVTSIGELAFFECSRLTSVYIPDSVISIGDNAFSNCPNNILTVGRDSYAETWCQQRRKKYTYAKN